MGPLLLPEFETWCTLCRFIRSRCLNCNEVLALSQRNLDPIYNSSVEAHTTLISDHLHSSLLRIFAYIYTPLIHLYLLKLLCLWLLPAQKYTAFREKSLVGMNGSSQSSSWEFPIRDLRSSFPLSAKSSLPLKCHSQVQYLTQVLSF